MTLQNASNRWELRRSYCMFHAPVSSINYLNAALSVVLNGVYSTILINLGFLKMLIKVNFRPIIRNYL